MSERPSASLRTGAQVGMFPRVGRGGQKRHEKCRAVLREGPAFVPVLSVDRNGRSKPKSPHPSIN
jgi:hypothetical protein